MRKEIIIAIIVLLVLVIIIGAVILYIRYMRGNILDGPGMVNETYNLDKIMKMDVKHGTLKSVRYSCSGDMNGNTNSTELKRQEDGTYVVETKYAQGHWEPIQCKVYSVSEEDVKELVNMIDKYNLTEWDKLDKEEMFILDGPQARLSFTYDDKEVGGSSFESYGFSLDNVYPDDATAVIKEFKQKLLLLRNEENLIKEYIEE